jgi:hypothetical protein
MVLGWNIFGKRGETHDERSDFLGFQNMMSRTNHFRLLEMGKRMPRMSSDEKKASYTRCENGCIAIHGGGNEAEGCCIERALASGCIHKHAR